MDDNTPSSSTEKDNEDDTLPLRWALILAISTAVGIGIGLAHGLIPGVTLGFLCAGFLHAVLPGNKGGRGGKRRR